MSCWQHVRLFLAFGKMCCVPRLRQIKPDTSLIGMLKEAHVVLDRARKDMCLVNQRPEGVRADDKALNSGELHKHSC